MTDHIWFTVTLSILNVTEVPVSTTIWVAITLWKEIVELIPSLRSRYLDNSHPLQFNWIDMHWQYDKDETTVWIVIEQ